MRSTNRLVTALLVLVILMLVGMLTGSWRVVLYPYLAVIGIIILLGVGSRRADSPIYLALGAGVSAVYFALFIWLDVVMGPGIDADTALIGGVVPSTAIYFFAIWPFGMVVAVLYSLFHRRLMSDDIPMPTGTGHTPVSNNSDQGKA